jgi:hypothetical protein
VTILRPTPANIKVRFFTFVLSRLFAAYIAYDITWQLKRLENRCAMLLLIVVLGYDNVKTLKAMGGTFTGGAMGRSASLASDLSKYD